MGWIVMTYILFREISEGEFSYYLFSALSLIFSVFNLTYSFFMTPGFYELATRFILAMDQECCYSNLFAGLTS
jgi:hypothetical protein